MTRGLESVFGLPSMDDILAETEETNNEIVEVEDTEIVAVSTDNDLMKTVIKQIDDHAKSMDHIYNDTIKHASDAADLAFDLDPARAPRMLEVSAVHYKTAMDAKNSKVDVTMKMMKLINETRKVQMDEEKIRHEMGTMPTDKADVILVEDRNALLKRLREEAAGKKDS